MGELLMGIDGGGTYTRVAIADAKGNLLSCVKWQGGAFLAKNPNAVENVQCAVHAAIQEAGCAPGDIAALTAGIAGYDKRRDLRWVKKLTRIKGLECKKQQVNDAEIAVAGAFLLQPGIAAIGGTGSIITGMNEKGKFIRNYDFGHYAKVSAPWLSYNAEEKIAAGEADDSDDDLVEKVQQKLGTKTLSQMKAVHGIGEKKYSDLGPVVTQAALRGSRIAQEVCMQAARETVEGIRLVGSCFAEKPIQVALVGSAVNSIFIKQAITELLAGDAAYLLTDPVLPPVLGACLLAMQSAKLAINEQIVNNLRKGAEQI